MTEQILAGFPALMDADFMSKHYLEILSFLPVTALMALLAVIVHMDETLRPKQRKTLRRIILVVASLILQNFLDYRLSIGPGHWLMRTLADIYGYAARPVILALFLRLIAPEKKMRGVCFPLSIGGLFGKLPAETAAELEPALRIFAVCIPFYGVAYLLRAFYQSTKQRFAASVFTVLEGAAIIVPLIYLFSRMDKRLIWLSFGLAELLSIALTVGVMQRVAKKKGFLNFMMLPSSEEKTALDLTIGNRIESAVEVSEKIGAFCKENGVDAKAAACLSVTAEELATNAAKYAYKENGSIDICLRIQKEALVLRFRDDGVPFNPLEYMDDSGKEVTGLSVARKLTPDIAYSRMLGFNVTVVTVRFGIPCLSKNE